MSLTTLVATVLPLGAAVSVGLPYQPDISRFPADAAILPARLENMRPGQIRDAAAKGAPCLLPVGVLEADGSGRPLGIAAAEYDGAIEAMATQKKAVIAPPIWYGPTGYILSGPAQGTVTMPVRAFSQYIEATLVTLGELGFQKIQIVVVHDPQGEDSPLRAAVRFAMGDLFNDLWKDPKFGENWWCRPDLDQLNWQRYSLVDLPRPAPAPALPAAPAELKLPLRLENMTPAQLGEALRRGLPCYLPVGVLENHGNHNPIGCDAIEATEPVVLAATQTPCVVAPTVWYGPTANAVSGPKLGSTDINGQIFQPYLRGVLEGLAAVGFRNIVVVQCHQGGGAEVTGIQMAIAEYRSGLYQRQDYGFGWGSKEAAKLRAPKIQLVPPPQMPSDHAGKNETSWMLIYRPDNTRLDLIRPHDYPFCWGKDDESNQATREQGQRMSDALVARWVKIMQGQIQPE